MKMNIERYIKQESTSNMTPEEWHRHSSIEDAKEAIMTLDEIEDFIIQASGTLEIAFEILRQKDIDHSLDLDLTSQTAWALFKLRDLKLTEQYRLEELGAA